MKTILITGGSEGLGKAIAAQLVANNKVIILATNEEKLRGTAKEIGCEYKICDVRDYAQVEKTISEVGAIDCLINNAGLRVEGPLDENDPQRIQDVMAINTLGTINVTRAIVPAMKQQKSGVIINIISQAGVIARPNVSVYDASKWAITGFTKSLQQELAPFGIAVTGLYPGKAKTQLFAKAGNEKDFSNGLDVEDVAKTVAFILSFDKPILFPGIEIKHLNG